MKVCSEERAVRCHSEKCLGARTEIAGDCAFYKKEIWPGEEGFDSVEEAGVRGGSLANPTMWKGILVRSA